MKKKALAGLLLVAPLTLLCACGGAPTGLNFSANWYSDTTTNNITGTEEILEYEVTYMTNEETPSLSYETGSYVTTLRDENYTANGEAVQAYRLHTELRLSGSYTLQGKTVEIEDYTVSDVWFLEARESLRPLRCEKEVHSTVPVATDPAEIATVYHYRYELTYAADLKSATYVVDDLTTEEDEPKEEHISMSRSGTLLDNEQIYFALRGLDMSAAATFNSIDPQTRQEVGLAFTETPTASTDPVSFALNGTLVDEQISTYHVSLRYQTKQPGPSRTLVYAARTSADNNTYRNVPVRMTNPVLGLLGTLTYTLKKATFNNK